MDVYNPNWVRVLHKYGHAPSSYWLFWHPKAWRLGKYHTIYKTWHNGVLYRNRYDTKSVRCFRLGPLGKSSPRRQTDQKLFRRPKN